jgi:hypothetical protein
VFLWRETFPGTGRIRKIAADPEGAVPLRPRGWAVAHLRKTADSQGSGAPRHQKTGSLHLQITVTLHPRIF